MDTPEDDTYLSVSTHHNGWGNDSGESWEYHHVCSVNCYIDLLIKCLKELEEYKDDGAEIAGMSWHFTNRLVKYLKREE